jgi:tRNA-specific 2-thiouridylase
MRVEVRGRLRTGEGRVEAKLRYRSPATPAAVTRTPNGFELLFDDPVYGVAPGQTAVLYVDDAIAGAGVIVSATGK